VLVPGDLSYAECDQDLWDKWGNIMSVLSSRVPLMVAPGNHDVEYYCARDNFDATAQKFLSYCSRYIMPHTCGEHTEPGEELVVAVVYWTFVGTRCIFNCRRE
jgi:metallophosphoesterase superfamily enzyme